MRRFMAVVSAAAAAAFAVALPAASASAAPAHPAIVWHHSAPPASHLKHEEAIATEQLLAMDHKLLKTRAAATTLSNGGWAGYSDTVDNSSTNSFLRASGAFYVPTTNCSASTYPTTGSYVNYDLLWSWYGIGGFPGNSVEQAGTLQECEKGYTLPAQLDWYVICCATGITVNYHNLSGQANGDKMSVNVCQAGCGEPAGEYQFFLEDVTRGVSDSWQYAEACPAALTPCDNHTAEALLEAVQGDDVPKFTYSSGSKAFLNVNMVDSLNGLTGGIVNNADWTYTAWNVPGGSGSGYEITSGALTDGGEEFEPVYQSCC